MTSSPVAQVQLNENVLVVSGTVDAQTVAALRAQGEKLISTADKALVVDLENLKTAHSVVLSMLLCWQRLAFQRKISLSYRAVSDRLASLAALSNLGDQLSGFNPDSCPASH
jgi:phospholipid transport system transporter-binding protein